MDITFRLNIHGYNNIEIVCVDRFMKSHTLAVGMLSDRTEGAIQVFVNFFAEQMGDNLDKLEDVLLDKVAAEHLTIHNFMPYARVLLCNFHSITAASKNLTKSQELSRCAGSIPLLHMVDN